MDNGLNRLMKAAIYVAGVGMAFIIGLVIWNMTTGQGTSHQQIIRRVDTLIVEVRSQSCLLSLPMEERTPAAQAECTAQALETG